MFDQHFEAFLADTDVSKQIHFQLRYQVYCLRKRFEDPQRFPSRLEKDAFDPLSAHFIVRSRKTGQWLAAMRLIVAAHRDLPISSFSRYPGDLGGQPTGEVSRFCILPSASGDQLPGKIDKPSHLRKEAVPDYLLSWVALGLIRAGRQYCLENDIQFCFLLIADSLARMLRRIGIEIVPVGPLCEHRGWRRPYIHDVRNGYRIMQERFPRIDEMFSRTPAFQSFSSVVQPAHELRLAANI